MNNLKKTARRIFVWSYERGTIQYDIICALILAFIFLVPPSCFVAKKPGNVQPSRQDPRNTIQGSKADLRP